MFKFSPPPSIEIKIETKLTSTLYDGVILISTPNQKIETRQISEAIVKAKKLDAGFENEISVIPLHDLPYNRLVYSPTGPIQLDYDDIRIVKNAAVNGIQRAIKAGITKPLIIIEDEPDFEYFELSVILGVLEATYVPIQHREFDPSKSNPLKLFGVYSNSSDKTLRNIEFAKLLENSRRVACDIGDADPERMSPPNIENYVTDLFVNTSIKVNVVKDVNEIAKNYPLFEAVNRAASGIERHQGRIIFLEYNPSESVTQTLYLVGKGVTYDTGGADVKINGSMVGMSRDKCGAAAVVGFLQLVSKLAPKHIRVVGGVSLVRNSIGSNSYVADEVITARSGARVRVVNTDAEGRMVMADVLCKLKEDALNAVNPHLFTVATLTGHAFLTAGEGYSIVIDNGPARKVGNAEKLQKAGELIGDPFEISRLRRDDLNFHRGKAVGDDVVQGNNQPSSRTPRGHQGPAAFLLLASGLDKHGSESEKPLKYSHLDIAASAGEFPKPATGSPILALAEAYLLNK